MIYISGIVITIIGIVVLPGAWRLVLKPRDYQDIVIGAAAFVMWIIIYGCIMKEILNEIK